MDSHIVEAASEPRLEEGPRRGIQRLAWGLQHTVHNRRSCHRPVRGEMESLRGRSLALHLTMLIVGRFGFARIAASAARALALYSGNGMRHRRMYCSPRLRYAHHVLGDAIGFALQRIAHWPDVELRLHRIG
jgi:hypothetical protein